MIIWTIVGAIGSSRSERESSSLSRWQAGVVAEVVGMVIPGQQADRTATYLRALEVRVSGLAEKVRNGLSSNAEKIGLIEEGGFQSARATSSERLDQVVDAVSRGLGEEDADVVRRKRLLVLFGELDDDEVALLNAYDRSYSGADRQAFEKVNRPPPALLQSPMLDLERNPHVELGREHLVRAALAQEELRERKKKAAVRIQCSKGDFKHTVEFSHFGRMFWREIGLETPFDAQQTQ